MLFLSRETLKFSSVTTFISIVHSYPCPTVFAAILAQHTFIAFTCQEQAPACRQPHALQGCISLLPKREPAPAFTSIGSSLVSPSPPPCDIWEIIKGL